MRLTWLATGLATTVLLAGGALAATTHWGPAMPQIRVDLRNGPDAVPTSLLLVYGDDGSDPFRDGALARNQHISNCTPSGTHCVALAGRRTLRSGLERRQSLQLRKLDGAGNPIIGGVSWNGPAYPSEVRVSCDLRMRDVAKTCHVEKIAV